MAARLAGRLRSPIVPMKTISCGVIVTDGKCLVLGHASRSPRWDIPKGGVEPGETLEEAARRELREETGLTAPERALTPLGTFPYLRDKDLALFVWAVPELPDPGTLVCSEYFVLRDGTRLPEFDRFGVFTLEDALTRIGKNLARLLAEISLSALT
jgi:8-oxo-dGTP pyrophosphatase MutT (NUDIX family)